MKSKFLDPKSVNLNRNYFAIISIKKPSNPSMTLRFKTSTTAPDGEGFKFVIPSNAFMIVRCTEAGSMRGMKGPYTTPRPVLEGQINFKL